MRQLMLLRHAKSSWDHADLDDIDRPLAPRGRHAAPLLGRYISRRKLEPDLVLCSSAARARQTWELVSAEWDHANATAKPRLDMRPSFYLARPAALMSAIQRIDDEVTSAMIIGHNPGMGQLARQLVNGENAKALKKMEKKFPTAALAVIRFPVESWSSLTFGSGELVSFIRPKDLT